METIEVPTLPETANREYNEAWRKLAKYFYQGIGLPKPNLVFDSGYPKNKKQWVEVYCALHSVLVIGMRNGWLTRHVDGKGIPIYLIHKA